MNLEEQFYLYYQNYLGIPMNNLVQDQSIFACEQRDKPINNWYYQYLIAIHRKGENIFSITPALHMEFKEVIDSYKQLDLNDLKPILKEYFQLKVGNVSIRKMDRMTIDCVPEYHNNKVKVVQLTKDILLSSHSSASKEEKERLWRRKKDEILQGRQYVILDDHRIVSYCKISDIDYGGGNLVVFTDEEYRGRGYGKAVVTKAVEWCLENGILPIYWVDQNNHNSLAIAKKLGFKKMSEELVVGKGAS